MHRQCARRVAADDLEDEAGRRPGTGPGDRGAEAGQVLETPGAGRHDKVAFAQAVAGRAAAGLQRFDLDAGDAGLAQALGESGKPAPERRGSRTLPG